MTLIIGTTSNSYAVVTADGLSKPHPKTGGGKSSDSYQKIFPVPNLPVAFVHHGFNIFDGKNSIDFLGNYVSANFNTIGISNLESIAESLRAYSESAVKNIFANPDNEGGVGFWIVGFTCRKNYPEIYEIFWPQRPEPFKHCQSDPWVFGGDGKDFLDPLPNFPSFQIAKLRQWPTQFTLRYHQALYRHAEMEQRRTGRTVFGGYQHQLIIEKSGWKWANPPKPQD